MPNVAFSRYFSCIPLPSPVYPFYLLPFPLPSFSTSPFPFLQDVNKTLSYRRKYALIVIKTHERNTVSDHTTVLCLRQLTGCFKKVAPAKTFWNIFIWLSLFAWNFGILLAIHIQIHLPVFVDLS